MRRYAGPPLRLLTRPGCHLCEEAAAALAALGAEFDAVEIDSEAELLARYGDRIPVILAGGVEIASAPIEATSLAVALAKLRATVA